MFLPKELKRSSSDFKKQHPAREGIRSRIAKLECQTTVKTVPQSKVDANCQIAVENDVEPEMQTR